MFKFFNHGVEPVETPDEEEPIPEAVKPPKPAPAELRIDGEERNQYLELAKSLGLMETAPILSEAILGVLVEENIHIYDNVQVAEFLNTQLGFEEWEWRGVRPKDVEHLKGWFSHLGKYRVPYSSRVNSQPIPLPVLMTMQKVLDKLPDVHFYVSCKKEPSNDDPFLCISGKNLGVFIIERWDEPSYRER